jgi:hypothetical protein
MTRPRAPGSVSLPLGSSSSAMPLCTTVTRFARATSRASSASSADEAAITSTRRAAARSAAMKALLASADESCCENEAKQTRDGALYWENESSNESVYFVKVLPGYYYFKIHR